MINSPQPKTWIHPLRTLQGGQRQPRCGHSHLPGKGRTLLSHDCLPVGDLLAETDKNVRDNLLTYWGTRGAKSMQGQKGATWRGRL
jgi:hypothetical protein